MKKYYFLITAILLLSSIQFVYARFENAGITIVLTNKDGKIIQNQEFQLLKSDGSFLANGKTNDKGIYKTKLLKGDSFIVLFNKENTEWRFTLDVPNKPGPHSYKFTFKVFLKATSQTVFNTKSNKSNKDNSICKTTIKIRDEGGMVLPEQPFEIKSRIGSFLNKTMTDSTGIKILDLKKGRTYDLVCEIEGHKFMTNFKTSQDADILDFTFEIDFSKMILTTYDTASLDLNDKDRKKLKTIVKVINQKQELVEDAEVVLEESNKRIFSAITEEGQVQTLLDVYKAYEVYVRKFGRTYHFEMVLPKDEALKEYIFIANVDFEFKPLRKFTLKVYFDTGKYSLRKKSFPELQKFYETLVNFPKMIVEIGGHTDSRGRASSNQKLSEKRALSVRRWLIKRGIDSERLKYKGYGETQPVATNKTAAGRQLNRRIEVSVLAE